MKFKNAKAELYQPKSANKSPVKYIAISAHHDDIEIMAGDGIVKGQSKDASFYAVVVTDGAGSARSGRYANYTDEEMKTVRIDEQKKAAEVGGYNGLALLNYSSAEAKDKTNKNVAHDIAEIIKELKPEIVYTHNVCDKHPTHIAVVLKVIEALRMLDKSERPKKLYGCEVWRDLDWLDDKSKTVFNLSGNEKLLNDLLSVFDSQIAGGKRYDLATAGRRRANATYAESHAVDTFTSVSYGMDLTELIVNDNISVAEFAVKHIEKFKENVENALK